MTISARALAIDDTVETWLDGYGESGWTRTVAGALSNASDYGIVWIVLAATRVRAPGGRRCRAVVDLAVAGAASYTTNRVVKRLVGRNRPTRQAPPDTATPAKAPSWGSRVRTPSSSSFPSGHTLAAFTASMVLGESPVAVLGWLGFSSGVALSRVYLRAHHATDALGGAVIGLGLGAGGRALARRIAECACAPRR